MVNTRGYFFLLALSAAELISRALAHGDDGGEGESMKMGAHVTPAMSVSNAMPSASTVAAPSSSESYFAYSKFGGLMLAHIVLMTIAWFFVLPIGLWAFTCRISCS